MCCVGAREGFRGIGVLKAEDGQDSGRWKMGKEEGKTVQRNACVSKARKAGPSGHVWGQEGGKVCLESMVLGSLRRRSGDHGYHSSGASQVLGPLYPLLRLTLAPALGGDPFIPLSPTLQ